MKKILFTKLLLVLMVANVFAQTDDDKKSSKSNMPEKKNAVKLNISSLFYKNIGVQYERALGPKIAVACQLRVMPKGTPVLYNSLEKSLQGDNNSSTTTGNIKFGSFAITPEFRLYTKKALKGFYLAPYFRFRNIGMNADFTFLDSNNVRRYASIDGKINTFGGGLMIGSHFNIGKSFSLDWFILGAHYTISKGNMEAIVSGAGMNAADQAKLKNELQTALDDSKIFKKNDVSVTSNSASIITNFGFVGLRGFGLNFGYRF